MKDVPTFWLPLATLLVVGAGLLAVLADSIITAPRII